MTFTASALVLAWVAILLLALGLAGLLRQVSVLTRQETVPAGAAAGRRGAGARTTRDLVGFRLPETDRAQLTAGVVLFVAPGCSSCGQTLDLLAADPLVANGAVPVTVVSTGGCPPPVDPDRIFTCLPQGRELMDRLMVPATPYLLSLDRSGTVRDTLLPDPDTDLAGWLRHTSSALPLAGAPTTEVDP
jgi:hypothetical protein